MTAFQPTSEQFTGCLIGQALGDALGFAVEGRPREVCERYVSEHLGPGNPTPVGRPPFPFGQYTDDSQFARELMLSLVEHRGFDPVDYAQRIAVIFANGRIVGRGRATSEAAYRLARRTAWTASGTPAPAAGNGSAMRAAPVGLFYWNQSRERLRAAKEQGQITHADPRCSAGAAAIAGAVAAAMRPGEIDADTFLSNLAREVVEVDAGFSDHLLALVPWLDLPPDEAAARIGRADLDPDFDDPWNGISPFVVGSVLWSLYAFLRSPDDYWESIRSAIAVGGDVDTTAAMTGAISGARNGLPSLPLPLASQVQDQGGWHFEALVRLAQRCHELADAG